MKPLPHVYTAGLSGGPDGYAVDCGACCARITHGAACGLRWAGDAWSPEPFLTAAVETCFFFTFRAIALASKVEFTSIELTGEGIALTASMASPALRKLFFAPDSGPRGWESGKGDGNWMTNYISRRILRWRKMSSEERIHGEDGRDDIGAGAADAPGVGALAAQRVDAARVWTAAEYHRAL